MRMLLLLLLCNHVYSILSLTCILRNRVLTLLFTIIFIILRIILHNIVYCIIILHTNSFFIHTSTMFKYWQPNGIVWDDRLQSVKSLVRLIIFPVDLPTLTISYTFFFID